MSLTIKTTKNRWWETPGIPCMGRPEFADTSLLPREGRSARLAELRQACMRCPVLRDCATEALTLERPVSQVRAGVVYGKS